MSFVLKVHTSCPLPRIYFWSLFLWPFHILAAWNVHFYTQGTCLHWGPGFDPAAERWLSVTWLLVSTSNSTDPLPTCLLQFLPLMEQTILFFYQIRKSTIADENKCSLSNRKGAKNQSMSSEVPAIQRTVASTHMLINCPRISVKKMISY